MIAELARRLVKKSPKTTAKAITFLSPAGPLYVTARRKDRLGKASRGLLRKIEKIAERGVRMI